MRLALHNSGLVGRELYGVLPNLHMDFVREGNALEKVLDGSGRAGDRSKERARLSAWARVGGRHGDVYAGGKGKEIKWSNLENRMMVVMRRDQD